MKWKAHWMIGVACMGVGAVSCQPREAQQPPQVQVLTVPQPGQLGQPGQPLAPPAPPAAAGGEARMGDAVMKVYAVPAGYQAMLAEELQRLLIVGDRPLGKVRQMPGDQMMVLAPESIHGGVVTLLDALQKAPPPAAQDQDIESRYWFVLAQPGEGADGAGLEAISATLAQVEAKQGPMTFTLMDQLIMRGSDGRESQSQSRYARVTQRLFPGSAQQTLGSLSITVHNRSLIETEVHIRAGQTLVLGQVGYEDPEAPRRDIVLRADGQTPPTPPPAQALLVIARFEQPSP